MKIKNIDIKIPTALAPMAGVSDMPFRLLAKEYGCGLLVSEMISSKGILYNNKKTLNMMFFKKEERPFAIQLFGSDPLEMAQATKKVTELEPDLIDVNMGCPVPKVVNNGEGSALMRKPELVYEIIARMVEQTHIPITVKFRSGWDEESINAPELSQIAEKAGASAIAIHARTRSQKYLGKADWNIIREVVQNVKIPVFGNGDIKNVQDAKDMIDLTGCQGIMIGRAAEGNPWIFSELKDLFTIEKTYVPPTLEERFDTILKHFLLLVDYKGEIIAVKEMRRHASQYIKGLPFAAEFRNLLNNTSDKDSFVKVIKEYRKKLI